MLPLIFISAKADDYEYAGQVYRLLKSEGLSVFFSHESLPELAVSDYRKQIDDALDRAEHMIVVTSSRANVDSSWVEAEWGLFINEKRSGRKSGNLITVIVGDLQPRDLPPSLRYYEVIPFVPESFPRILRYVKQRHQPTDQSLQPPIKPSVDEGLRAQPDPPSRKPKPVDDVTARSPSLIDERRPLKVRDPTAVADAYVDGNVAKVGPADDFGDLVTWKLANRPPVLPSSYVPVQEKSRSRFWRLGILSASLLLGTLMAVGVYLWVPFDTSTLTLNSGGTVYGVGFSPDGRTLASGSADKNVALWDVQTGALKQTLTGHGETVHAVVFSPDGKILASGAGSKIVELWDVQTGALKLTLTGNFRVGAGSISFSPDGKTLATGCYDQALRLWDVETQALKQTLTVNSQGVDSVAFSRDGKTLASGDDKTVKLWDLTTATVRQTLTGHTGDVVSVLFSPDGTTLASGSYDGTVRLWDALTGALKLDISRDRGTSVSSIAFSPDGKTLAIGQGSKVKLCDAQTGELKRTLNGQNWVESVAFSPDGKSVAGGGGKTVKLWKVD